MPCANKVTCGHANILKNPKETLSPVGILDGEFVQRVSANIFNKAIVECFLSIHGRSGSSKAQLLTEKVGAGILWVPNTFISRTF